MTKKNNIKKEEIPETQPEAPKEEILLCSSVIDKKQSQVYV